jgi:hypothetical protein
LNLFLNVAPIIPAAFAIYYWLFFRQPPGMICIVAATPIGSFPAENISFFLVRSFISIALHFVFTFRLALFATLAIHFVGSTIGILMSSSE